MVTLIVAPSQSPEGATLSLVGRARRRHRRAIRPLLSSQFNLFRCRRWREIVIELPGLGLRKMPIRKTLHHNPLFPTKRAPDFQLVANLHQPVWFGRHPVDRNLAAFARAVEPPTSSGIDTTRQPDIKPDIHACVLLRLRVWFLPMPTWSQNYTPLGHWFPSALLAAIPLISAVLLACGSAHLCAARGVLYACISAMVIAMVFVGMPPQLALPRSSTAVSSAFADRLGDLRCDLRLSGLA